MYNYRRSHKQDKYQHQVLINLGVLLAVIILLSTVGIGLLIKSTTLIARLFNHGNTQDGQMAPDLLLPPELFDIPDATNSAQLKITGSGQQGTTVSLFLNDQEQKQILLDKDDFEADLNLEKGDNTIYAIAEEKNKHTTVKSKTYTVTFSDQKPTLTVTSPNNNDKSFKDEIAVAGKTDPGNTVMINDSPTTIDSSGKFERNVKLAQGINSIKIVVVDQAGNTNSQDLSVTYEKD